MQELATLMRPASLTDGTEVKLVGNALNCLHTCMQILEQHYLERLGHLTRKHPARKLAGGIQAWRTTTTTPWDEDQYDPPEALHQQGTLGGPIGHRRHHITWEAKEAVGPQDTTGTGNHNHCHNDPRGPHKMGLWPLMLYVMCS
ncbi:hypothetical protein SKAU_G00361300 [Synaphobranchus kaupii]|uniref:Uncharacterized protein n=1 Tax=Synaphobranchus kaupii TaxID=118154 RepID=A0A9Q1IH53_SYNKA|nr:hypothetical protein SKAU_G00361300 [Synaphobranchus kaupii]